jgi:deoxyadenosine/deoxycytidine kinase
MKRVSATTPPTTAPAIAPPSQLKKYERVSQTPQFEQLEVDVDTLMARIKTRGRPEEQAIPRDFHERLSKQQ